MGCLVTARRASCLAERYAASHVARRGLHPDSSMRSFHYWCCTKLLDPQLLVGGAWRSYWQAMLKRSSAWQIHQQRERGLHERAPVKSVVHGVEFAVKPPVPRRWRDRRLELERVRSRRVQALLNFVVSQFREGFVEALFLLLAQIRHQGARKSTVCRVGVGSDRSVFGGRSQGFRGRGCCVVLLRPASSWFEWEG